MRKPRTNRKSLRIQELEQQLAMMTVAYDLASHNANIAYSYENGYDVAPYRSSESLLSDRSLWSKDPDVLRLNPELFDVS